MDRAKKLKVDYFIQEISRLRVNVYCNLQHYLNDIMEVKNISLNIMVLMSKWDSTWLTIDLTEECLVNIQNRSTKCLLEIHV